MKVFFRHFTIVLCWAWGYASFAASQQKLVLFGGGPRPSEAISDFVQFSGGAKANILVVTWASKIPTDVFGAISADLVASGALYVQSALKAPRNSQEKREFLTQLAQADGVFFSGGDQSRIMLVLQDRDLKDAIVKKYSDGFVVAGTSAGTAMMSAHMMTGNSSPLGVGLGLLTNVIVDTHFIKRQRTARLEKAIAQFPDLLGVGIDEGAALVVTDGQHARVVGPEQVVIIKAQPQSCQDLLKANDCYNLSDKKRENCMP